MPITPVHADRLKLGADDAAQPLGARHQLHRVDRSCDRRHDRHLGRRSRAHTIHVAVAAGRAADDIVQPGHVFPLIAQPGGVLARAGHTEACCDLARLAGLTPAAVLCEIMNDDGTMARLPDLEVFAQQHGLSIGTIADLIHYRSRTERLVERIAERPLATQHGAFRLVVYRDKLTDATHLALVRGPISPDTETLVRVHEPLSVMDLLDAAERGAFVEHPRALATIAEAGRGVIVLLHRPESRRRAAPPRGRRSGTPPPSKMDLRDYGIGAQILRDLNVGKHAAARAPAQDAEHGGLRSRGHRLRRAAARRRASPLAWPSRRASTPAHDAALRDASASCCRASIPTIGDGLLAGALRGLKEAGVADDRDRRCDGARARSRRRSRCSGMAQSGDFDALVAIGAVIRGDTYHFEIVANESARGVVEVALEFGIPIGNGILTCDTDEQARSRMQTRRATRRRRRRSRSRTCSMTSTTPRRPPARARARAAGPLPAAALGQRRRARSRRQLVEQDEAGAPIATYFARAVARRHVAITTRWSRAVAPHSSRKTAELSPIERAILAIGAWEFDARASTFRTRS